LNHISQGLISPLASEDSKVKTDSRLEANSRIQALEAASWLLLLRSNLEQDELPEFRMKDNLFSM